MAAALTIRVTPNASRDEVAGDVAGVIRIRLRAPAVEGKANAALVQFVADALGVRRSSVSITHGQTGRTKSVEVEGLDSGAVATGLLAIARRQRAGDR